ncbi:UNKNOWN [Stylonychia lemnae]|uniref:Morn repeat protein n=1 Tax=Stylonychia lemnae TaxID=5949 RepID=A0A078B4I7_STYLE|nr:UNKNOWN [Stylonychia lemnae]|eukprot:CDW89186.1 UNKNOWN [Stylonychia lemnae]
MDQTNPQNNSANIYDPEKQPLVGGEWHHDEARPDYVPAPDTIPNRQIAMSLTKGILKKLNEAGSLYEGERNLRGLRHGQGKCSFLDGSYYIGSWVDDKREGKGEYHSRDGFIYNGDWVNDMKHGEGQLTKQDSKEILYCTFINDKRHGYGHKMIDGSKTEVFFYNDTEVSLQDQNPDYFLGSLENLFLLIAACFVAFLAEYCYESKALYILAAIFYIIAIIWSTLSIKKYFAHAISGEELDNRINEFREKAPELTMNLENYHYNHKGNRQQTSICQEKLIIGEYIDQSPNPDSIAFVKETRITRLDFKTKVEFSVPANKSKGWQEEDFRRKSKKDTHCDFKLLKTIKDCPENAIVYNGSLPIYCNQVVHFIFSLFALSWLIRVIFVFNSQKVKYKFKKYIVK